MAEIKLYIATSLDGFIARKDGSLDWLYALPNPNQIDHGYADFFSGIDVVVMGKSTYEEILRFGVEWPYMNCKSYILTSDKNYKPKTDNTETLNSLSKADIEKLKKVSIKGIWIVGGGKTIVQFLDAKLIDEMILCIVPTILGSGIPLFPNPQEQSFELTKSEKFETGAVNLTYRKKNN